MPLDIANTILNAAPYYDDYDQTKNFHRILFRPAVAVQARELTQLQTILQNQIERFGNHIFKDGSVVQGCSIEYIKDLEYVGVEDQFLSNTSLALNDASLIGAIAIGQNSDVQALIFSTTAGFIRQTPGRFFLRYTKPGANSRTFIPGEEIKLYGETTSYVEDIVLSVANATPFASANGLVVDGVQPGNTANVLARAIVVGVDTVNNTVTVNNVERRFSANSDLIIRANSAVNSSILAVNYDLSNEIASIRTLTSNTDGIAIANTDVAGFAYGAHVSDGIIYQKGNFIRVDAQNVIVNPSSNDPSSYFLGFVTSESVVTETSDSTLYDNALGYPNFNAPGAHRLKLTATLVAKLANTVSNTDIFFPIVEFSNSGVAFERTDPQYAALGDEIAKRTYEEAGHFIIKPFTLSSNTDPGDANNLIYDVSPGLAYVRGVRNELLNNVPVTSRRGTNTTSYSAQIVSMSYGNYVDVKEVRGYFPTDQSATVDFYGTAQGAISNALTPASAASGTVIGSANIREIVHVSGVKGSANAVYRMYLFNISMANSSYSFANVASIAYTSGTANAFADPVTTSLSETSYTPLIFSLGARAVKSLADANGVKSSSYYYNAANTTASLDSTGAVNFTVPSGGGILGFTDTSDFSEEKIDLVLSAAATTANLTTTATLDANGLITDTGIGLLYEPGEGVGHGANVYLVTSIVSNDAIQVANTLVANTLQTLFRYHYAGSLVPLDGTSRTITINANNQATINLGASYTNAPVAAEVRFYTLQNQASEIKKEVNRATVVLATVANTGTDYGPWNLGIPDVFKLTGVYAANGSGNTTTADLSINYIDDFELIDGQKDAFYEHSSVVMKPSADANAYAGATLAFQFDHFVANNTTGKGYFSVDSYPIDDSISANSLSTIGTYEVPTFYSSSQNKAYDLRDSIDFRPYRTATANVTSTLRLATLNPAATNTFDSKTTTFNPYPGQNFNCNFTHYLGRKDILTLTPAGDFEVVEGVASLTPRTPSYPAESLAIANMEVPPYPSLTDNEKVLTKRTDYTVKISIQNHKRYTMKDISTLEQRISRLEYYTSLNALEKAAADMKITSSSGLDRFKNGIFVDPQTSHAFGRVDIPQYRWSIDDKNGFGRPMAQPEFFELELDTVASVGVTQTGDMLIMDYTETEFLSQGYATQSRKLSGAPPSYNGSVDIKPNRWSEVEVLARPVSVVATDKASIAVRNLDAAPLCATYGWWRGDKNFQSNNTSNNVSTDTLRQKTNGTTEVTYSLSDTQSKSITVQPYIRAREVAFKAVGLKPYTVFKVYIDDFDVSEFAAPAEVANSNATDESFATRTAMWGSDLQTNSRGELIGKISIPSARFKSGRHTVKLLSQDIDSITQQQISSAAASFEVDVSYQEPPPAVISVTVTPPAPTIAPTAKYTYSGNLYSNSSTSHVITFKDASTNGSNPITTWLWNFGDGNTYNGQTPPAKTYDTTDSVQSYNVSLTVTDSVGKSATYTKAITLYKLTPPAPPPTPTANAQINITPYSGGKVIGSGVATGIGQVVAQFVATTTRSYAGAFYEWTINVQSGNTIGAPVITGTANNTSEASLVDNSTTGASLSSVLSVKADYKYSNGFIIGTKTINFTLKTQAAVQHKPDDTRIKPDIYVPSSGYGSGGCVVEDSFIGATMQAKYLKAGMMVDTFTPPSMMERLPAAYVLEPIYRKVVEIESESGAKLVCSVDTPFNLRHATVDLEEGMWKYAPDMLGEDVLVDNNGQLGWEKVVSVKKMGDAKVVPIDVGGRSFAAGVEPNKRIYSHNMVKMAFPGLYYFYGTHYSYLT